MLQLYILSFNLTHCFLIEKSQIRASSLSFFVSRLDLLCKSGFQIVFILIPWTVQRGISYKSGLLISSLLSLESSHDRSLVQNPWSVPAELRGRSCTPPHHGFKGNSIEHVHQTLVRIFFLTSLQNPYGCILNACAAVPLFTLVNTFHPPCICFTSKIVCMIVCMRVLPLLWSHQILFFKNFTKTCQSQKLVNKVFRRTLPPGCCRRR